MKMIKYILPIAALLISISSMGQVSVTGTAYTEIVPLVTIKEKVQMNIGRFSTESGGGSIIITPEGVRIGKGAVVMLNGYYSQAIFIISGSPNNSLSVILPSAPQPLYHNNSSNRVFLENWTYSIPGTKDGKTEIYIGATLEVGPDDLNPAGIYSGTYQVNFIFN